MYLRAIAGKIIGEDSLLFDLDVCQWHTYNLLWRESGVAFNVDNAIVFESPISPRGPLGLVIWIDNQYAAWAPEGRIGMGTLQQKAPAWMEDRAGKSDEERVKRQGAPLEFFFPRPLLAKLGDQATSCLFALALSIAKRMAATTTPMPRAITPSQLIESGRVTFRATVSSRTPE